MRRELELRRTEAQLLDCVGSHFIGREEKLASLSACHRARSGLEQKLGHRSTKEVADTVFSAGYSAFHGATVILRAAVPACKTCKPQ